MKATNTVINKNFKDIYNNLIERYNSAKLEKQNKEMHIYFKEVDKKVQAEKKSTKAKY